MKKSIVLFMILFFCNALDAQEQNYSLKAQELYNQAYQALLDDEYVKAEKYLNEGKELSTGDLRKQYYYLFGFLSEVYGGEFLFNEPERACKFYQEAIEYYLAAGKQSATLLPLKNLGKALQLMGKYEDALKVWDEALKNADLTQNVCIDIIFAKKSLHRTLNQQDQDSQLSSVLRQIYGKLTDPITKAQINVHLAKEAYANMHYDLARVHYEELDKLMEELGEEYREFFNNISSQDKLSILRKEGNYNKAIELQLKNITEIEHDSNRATELSSLYIHLAYDYATVGDKKHALIILDKLVNLLPKLDISNLVKSGRYKAMASIYSSLKMWKKAEKYTDAVLALGQYEEDIYLMRANISANAGKYKTARRQYEDYSKLVADVYGEHSLQYAKSLRHLAHINAFCKEYDTAADIYTRASKLARDAFSQGYRYISNSDRQSFWSYYSQLFSQMASFGIKAGLTQDDFSESAYNALLLSKGLLLSSDNSLSSIIYKNGDTELISQYENCKKKYTEIEVYKSKGRVNSSELAQMYHDLQTMESDIQLSAVVQEQYMSFMDVEYRQLESALKENEIVIDFLDFPGAKNPSNRFYAAFIYKNGWKHPKLIMAYKGKDIEEFLNEGYAWDNYGVKAADFAKFLFKPFREHIKKGDTVYWIPSGDLHKISIESSAIQGMPEMELTIRQLSSARMVCAGNENFRINTAALYGGLDYSIEDSSSNIYNSRERGNNNYLKPLPQSYEEISLIRDMLSASNSDIDFLNGTKGTEDSFIRYSSHSPDLIHVSTHGFYYSKEEAVNVNTLAGFNNAMFLSGLVMAGGNAGWTETELYASDYGGILTADDISKLDLSGTELVVLSACNTAQGEVTAEGIYGLQRAFKKAGVDKILMTLWTVNDYVSKEFMREFYEGLINRRLKPENALANAKTIIRGKYHDPYYWAGYVLLD